MQRASSHVAVSAFFESEAGVEAALLHLEAEGVPRDLIEVVVSPEAARRFYGSQARRLGNQALRFAGIGALVGLIASSCLSIVFALVFGFSRSSALSVVQLLGPNVGTLLGAGLGGAWGYFVHKSPHGAYHRALERDAILVVVKDRPLEDAPRISETLVRAGGQDVQQL